MRSQSMLFVASVIAGSTTFGCSLPRSATGAADGGAMDAAVMGVDVGPRVDAPGHDAFVPGVDAFVPPGNDAFVPGVDAFVPPVDAFVPPVDAFVPPVDAFVPPVDAFVPPVDAFVAPVDAFVPPVDAWTRPTCTMLFGGESGFMLCTQTPTSCELYVNLGNTRSCDDVCAAHGQTCTAARNNGGAMSRCMSSAGADTCASVHQDELCTCTR